MCNESVETIMWTNKLRSTSSLPIIYWRSHVRELNSPHIIPASCVDKPQESDGWFLSYPCARTGHPTLAVIAPSGMIWEVVITFQGIRKAPDTINVCVAYLFKSVRDCPRSYFDDILAHIQAMDSRTWISIQFNSKSPYNFVWAQDERRIKKFIFASC